MPRKPSEKPRRKKRLAYLFERFPTFTQTFCFREVVGVREQGVDPLIFSIRNPKGEPFQNFPPNLRESTQYVPADLKGAITKCDVPFPMTATVQAWRLLKWLIPDRHRVHEAAWLGAKMRQQGVTHIHSHFASLSTRVAWWIRRYYGINYSFTAHANDVFCEDADSPVTRDKTIFRSRLVVTESEYSAVYLRKRFPADADKIHQVYNGIDVSKYQKPRSNPGEPLILAVGRYIDKKGFPDLIEALALLRDQPFKCLIVGLGPKEAELKELVASRGLEGRVEITGPKSGEEIVELLSRATVFALPCIETDDGGSDNLPTVIMEAMSAGVPVVSTSVAGVPEMVRDLESGYLVPQHDPRALATAIGRLIANRPLASEMGARGRELAEKYFDISKTSARLCDLWQRYGAIDLN